MEKSICLFLVCILVAGILNGCAGDALSTEGQSAASTQSTNSTQQQPPTSTGGTEPTTPPTEPIRPTDSTAPTAPETQPAQLLTVQPRICIWDLSEEELERIDRAKKYYPWGEDFLAHMPDLYVYAIFGDIYVMEELRGGYDDAINREFGYDWMFVHPSGPYFQVLVGEQFFPLREAVANGYLTEAQIFQLYVNYYGNCPNLMRVYPSILAAPVKEAISQAIMEQYSLDEEETEIWMNRSAVIGLVGHAYVVMEPIFGEPCEEYVEGYHFDYIHGSKVVVYFQGALYSLQEAVDQGIVPRGWLEAIYANFLAGVKYWKPLG